MENLIACPTSLRRMAAMDTESRPLHLLMDMVIAAGIMTNTVSMNMANVANIGAMAGIVIKAHKMRM
jgi:hypothetical protein